MPRLFQDTLAKLSGGDVENLQPQSVSNILLAAATVQRRSFSPDFFNHALAKIVAEGNSQSVHIPTPTPLPLTQSPDIKHDQMQ
jgi:hypothetical protein